MDPDACCERVLSALDAGDLAEAWSALADLRGWLARGGFWPKADLLARVVEGLGLSDVDDLVDGEHRVHLWR